MTMRSNYTVLACLACAATMAAGAADIKARMKARVEKLAELKKELVIGEDSRGFVGVLKEETASDTAKKLVADENADRKLVYEAIAKKVGTTAEKVGESRAKTIHERAASGVMLQQADGTWKQK